MEEEQFVGVVEAPGTMKEASRCSHRSIETLIVVLAVITLIGVIAGIIARLCGGRHFGRNGENDIEGWIEKKCRNCIDGGLNPPPQEQEPNPVTQESKK